jgi:hypothetical protein
LQAEPATQLPSAGFEHPGAAQLARDALDGRALGPVKGCQFRLLLRLRQKRTIPGQITIAFNPFRRSFTEHGFLGRLALLLDGALELNGGFHLAAECGLDFSARVSKV